MLLCASSTRVCSVLGMCGIGTDSQNAAKLCSCLVAARSVVSQQKRGKHLRAGRLGCKHTQTVPGAGIALCAFHLPPAFLSSSSPSVSSCSKHCFYFLVCSLSLPSFQAAKDPLTDMSPLALLMRIVGGFRATKTCTVNRFGS